MNDQAKEKLNEFYSAIGYPDAGADPLNDFILDATIQTILNLINQKELPQGLVYLAVYWAAGNYLSAKKNTGKIEPEQLDLSYVVSSITEGDTTVSFHVGDGAMTPEQRFDAFTQWLTQPRTAEIYRYRKLVW